MSTFYLNRQFRNLEETAGVLSFKKKILCHTLEDEKRAVKIYGETRIPAGTYELVLREFGSHHIRYSQIFPNIHKGMIELKNVPNFDDILIHILNFENETDGCLGVGTENRIEKKGRFSIRHSTKAYKYVYPIIADRILTERTFIKIIDECDNEVYDG